MVVRMDGLAGFVAQGGYVGGGAIELRRLETLGWSIGAAYGDDRAMARRSSDAAVGVGVAVASGAREIVACWRERFCECVCVEECLEWSKGGSGECGI